MIVVCENCNKKYRIQPHKLKSPKSRFKCTQCGHTIYVYRPSEDQHSTSTALSYDSKDYENRLRDAVMKRLSPGEFSVSEKSASSPKTKNKADNNTLKKKMMGLWGKMMTFFFIVPITIMLILGGVAFLQLKNYTTFVDEESAKVVSLLAEDKVAEIGRAVASQAGIFLKTHPKLNMDEFMQNPVFRRIAVQKVSGDNYTMLYQLPDQSGALRVWAHKNPNLIGKDLREASKVSFSPQGDDYSLLLKILAGVRGLRESKGHYDGKDDNGNRRGKYLVCTPIEGTPYVIASSAFLDEFAVPVQYFEMQVRQRSFISRWIVLGTILTAIVSTGIVAFIYSSQLTRTITELTDAANQISVGDLWVQIKVNRKDELGDLAQAIRRLQESTRIFLKRLGDQEKN